MKNTSKEEVYLIEKNPKEIFPRVQLKTLENHSKEELEDVYEDAEKGKTLCCSTTIFYTEEYENFYDEDKPIIECPECGEWSGVYNKVERFRLNKSLKNGEKDAEKPVSSNSAEGLENFS